MKMAVEGHSPGGECHGCVPSSSEDTSTGTLTLSDIETISLGSYTIISYPATSTPTEYATSAGNDGSSDQSALDSGPVITPTPFASAPVPSDNTPYGPPSASATYVTAGSARVVAHCGVSGVIMLVMALLAR